MTRHLTLFLLIFVSPNAFAYEYSIKNAFCTDYASNRSSIYSNTFNYDFQTSYNFCMRNARRLIDSYEENLLKSNEEQRKKMIKNQLEYQKRKEKERKEKIKNEEKIRTLVNELENIFK
tara:strand:- start:103 stop:459 length:357 start_codon:yes stop_codon:yes gene_type:complete